MAVCSHNNGVINTSTFDNVNVTAAPGFITTASPLSPKENVATGPALVANITNANDDTGTYSGTVNWGDGSPVAPATVAITGTTGTVTGPPHLRNVGNLHRDNDGG